jgi:putative ABC transport system permease protein
MRGYRALLHCYPASFRREYGAEMAAAYAAKRRVTTGPLAVVLLWIETLVDVLTNAAAVHAEMLGQDLRYAVRTLRNAPGFALTAVIVTALGVGANTAAFSVADFVLVRPLPFVQADRLVTLWEHSPTDQTLQPSPANLADWRRMTRSFSQIGAYHTTAVDLLGSGEPLRVQGAAVTPEMLPMLGVHPLLGRLVGGNDDPPGATTIVISSALWRGPFGADPAILGRRVVLDGSPFVVVGVMPQEFNFPDRHVSFWRVMTAAALADEDRSNNYFYAIGRLKPGVTMAQAAADLDGVTAQLARQYPDEDGAIRGTVLGLRAYYAEYFSQTRALLVALCGAALCVLLIACANLANLLLGRALMRQRELAVRTALGAGRERLVRQLVTESLLLACIGGALGVVIALFTVPLLTTLIPDTLPLAALPTIDLRVLLLAGALTLATGIGFGVIPALQIGRRENLGALREGERAGGGRRAHLRSALVIVEIMASVVLLVSAGLLLRAMWRLQSVDPGFRAENVLTMRTELPSFKYGVTAQRNAYYTQVLTAVRALPGVQSAGFTSFLPMAMGGGIWPVVLPGETGPRTKLRTTSLRFITPGYLQAMQIALIRGRDIAATDVREAPNVAVVSESFAKRYWPGADPLGQHFTFAFQDRMVVGVVHDIMVRGPERTAEPQAYLSSQQVPDSSLSFYAPKDLAIRTSGAPEGLAPAVRAIIRAADAEQPILNVRTLSDIVSDQTASRAAQVRLLAAFALIAFLLAAIGIHGVLSFMVSQRRREIGIRMALGARPGQVVGMVAGQAGLLALAGIIPGALLAYAAAKGMASLLAGVQPSDPGTFAAVTLLCATMIAIGTTLSAIRAVRVSPATVMRGD